MMRSRRRAATAAVFVLGCVALLASCGRTVGAAEATQTATAGTPSPTSGMCRVVTGFEHAGSVPLPMTQLPPDALAYSRAAIQGAGLFTVVEYHVCVPKASLVASYPPAIFGGNWRSASQFPMDGAHLAQCGVPQACWMLPNGDYAMVDQVTDTGNGLVLFRVRLATPPGMAACDPAVYNVGVSAGQGGLQIIAPAHDAQVPLPPATVSGQSIWGTQDTGKGYIMPYVVTPLCSQGTPQSIVAFLKQHMPDYGWAPLGTDGLGWQFARPDSVIVYVHALDTGTPAHWSIAENYVLNGPPPVMPTPIPAGPNATCSSVPGLEHAGSISLPAAQFPADMVAVATSTVHGSAFTVMDYLACAPNFELTAKPENGSGGEPLYAMFMEGNWNTAGNFPFDGATLRGCDDTAVGNYLTQWCWAQGITRYVDIERVSEPGKGLVVFHLLYAYRP